MDKNSYACQGCEEDQLPDRRQSGGWPFRAERQTPKSNPRDMEKNLSGLTLSTDPEVDGATLVSKALSQADMPQRIKAAAQGDSR